MSYYIPQQDEIDMDVAHLEPEHELTFDDMHTPEGEHYRFTDTLTLPC